MRNVYLILPLIFSLAFTCCKNNNTEHEEISTEEKLVRDSISKAEQRRKADSLKKQNPLLIMPPDSTYTGDYIDKYPGGIIKFRGFFRVGKRHGQWMSFYPSGLLWSEMHYDKGLRHGPNITYYETGGKRYEGMYKNDSRDSIWIYYDSIGRPAEKVLFKNDQVIKKLPLK
ncbi:MAG: hypothetical protein JWO32_765 [Bacteroidetes bacterium]|jgi:antitoxin component YwqK of YwqJK toxin-antitoxin module|nr:hypothetical protein [Bacteroidota bacterium]